MTNPGPNFQIPEILTNGNRVNPPAQAAGNAQLAAQVKWLTEQVVSLRETAADPEEVPKKTTKKTAKKTAAKKTDGEGGEG